MNLHVLLGDVATPPKHFGQGFSKSPSTGPEVLILHTRSTQVEVHRKEILLLTVFWNITLFHICFLLSAHFYDGRVKFKSAWWNIFKKGEVAVSTGRNSKESRKEADAKPDSGFPQQRFMYSFLSLYLSSVFLSLLFFLDFQW